MSREELAKHIEPGETEVLASSGMDASEDTRSASFLQKDGRVMFSRSLTGDVDILDIREALEKDPQARECFGQAFNRMGREYPKDTEGGYFIRIKKGAVVQMPIQACLFLKSQGFKQKVHNVVVVEEGAKVYLITGCSAADSAKEGFHLGLSEFFLKKGAYLNFTMIHSWREDISVKPVGIALLEEDSTYVSNYICLKPVKDITMYPTAVLSGDNSRASFNSLVLSHPGCLHDIGSRAIMRGKNTQSEMVARAVSLGGNVISRGHVKAEAPDVKGHLECRGLILSEKGHIHAIPEMETDYRDVELSHEAAIGKISKDEIEYLCSRGFSAAQAQSIIVRGFMDVNILGLPPALQKEIADLEEKTLKANF